ncbi:MAG: class I SAM-dependent methyltransferase [Candidatus Sungbacteria bacterium]|nr:class I SAM-dependent methyltransferase [Candidatus Sungbacteria bacterium]
MPVFLFLIIGMIVAASIAFIVAIFSFTIWSDLKGAPFVKSRKDRIETMLELAEIKPGTRVLELGSGDATLLIAAAQRGAYAQGVEINPLLAWYSRKKIKRAGMEKQIRIVRQNFYECSLAETKPDAVFLYLLPGTLKKLREKLYAELPPGTRIISNAFRIEGLIPVAQENNVYAYHLS